MSGVSWFVLFVGFALCADSAWKTVQVWALPNVEPWVVPVLALATVMQAACWGWLFWMTLQ